MGQSQPAHLTLGDLELIASPSRNFHPLDVVPDDRSLAPPAPPSTGQLQAGKWLPKSHSWGPAPSVVALHPVSPWTPVQAQVGRPPSSRTLHPGPPVSGCPPRLSQPLP